jgi:hypothetical protein
VLDPKITGSLIARMTGEAPDMNEAARTRRTLSRVAVPQWRGSSLHRAALTGFPS